jgi:hypothetical protein
MRVYLGKSWEDYLVPTERIQDLPVSAQRYADQPGYFGSALIDDLSCFTAAGFLVCLAGDMVRYPRLVAETLLDSKFFSNSMRLVNEVLQNSELPSEVKSICQRTYDVTFAVSTVVSDFSTMLLDTLPTRFDKWHYTDMSEHILSGLLAGTPIGELLDDCMRHLQAATVHASTEEAGTLDQLLGTVETKINEFSDKVEDLLVNTFGESVAKAGSKAAEQVTTGAITQGQLLAKEAQKTVSKPLEATVGKYVEKGKDFVDSVLEKFGLRLPS